MAAQGAPNDGQKMRQNGAQVAAQGAPNAMADELPQTSSNSKLKHHVTKTPNAVEALTIILRSVAFQQSSVLEILAAGVQSTLGII